MSLNNDWKKELYKASRTTIINISNDTDYILQRVYVKLQQGLLRIFPPEIIAPNSKIEFASESNAFVTGTKGSVIYLLLPPSIAPLHSSSIQSLSNLIGMKLWEPFLYVTVEWSNPYWTTHSCSISASPHNIIETKYYLSHEEINRQIHSEVKTTIKSPNSSSPSPSVAPNTPTSPKTINSKRDSTSSPSSTSNNTTTTPGSNNNNNGNNSIKNSTSSLGSNSTTSTTTPTSPSSLVSLSSTLSFFSSLSNSPIRGESITGGKDSFPFPWNNSDSGASKDNYSLEHGNWYELPPEGIPPGATIEFGTAASGICTGTNGSVNYYSNGLKGDIKLTFNNPFIGENTFSSHCPPQYTIEKHAIPGTTSTVVFVITDQNQQQHQQQQSQQQQQLQSQPQNSNNNNNNLSNSLIIRDYQQNSAPPPQNTFRMISLNLGLLINSTNYSLEDRVTNVANMLINMSEKYDIICLQESGEDSGLYFASTFPTPWSDFRLFNEGIGLDVHSSKGIQAVKLDTSSIKENSILYVFNAHLQSNPIEGSVAWQMVSGDDKLKKAQTVRTLQLQSIRDFISTELYNNQQNKNNNNNNNSSNNSNNGNGGGNGQKKSIGLILCGDMNIIGENEQIISDEGNQYKGDYGNFFTTDGSYPRQ
ncbi:hypothetical protein DFA_10561 [Cavenderia fasciculata]|uniref:Endonuclease/exonuclease/phosphatase domain-containing protein n=1 Tax=Cavenderia fasciculata TaxID=261658 RepID=F4QAK0_CACFS|nr:uncharacterized protein DFA_10561 [Cavenderia fasciculata]EGG15719.1 hypothetical protein DFA_10561 [Cavenderia fasciculata]|eukprot:XP_004354461.1 hypothetical protein DFA_10561 [Cavenderia fasciculata]